MKKIMVLVFSACLLAITHVEAQNNSTNSYTYKNAIGVKFYPTSVTLKHFLTGDKNALEFLGYFFNYGSRITALYEIHGNINGLEGLRYYIGPGVHVGFYNAKHTGATTAGVDGVVGLDYKINSAPINLSIDFQPSLEFGNGFNTGFVGWGGIAIRYTF